MTAHRSSGARGFTLLETLVAVALVAAGTAVATRVVRAGAATTASDAAYTDALVLAMDELTRARLDPPPPGERTTAASHGLAVTRTVEATATPFLLQVTVRVTPAGASAGVTLMEIVRATSK